MKDSELLFDHDYTDDSFLKLLNDADKYVITGVETRFVSTMRDSFEQYKQAMRLSFNQLNWLIKLSQNKRD